MKRIIPALIGTVLALLLFAAPGNFVKAEGLTTNSTQPAVTSANDSCGCQDVTHIVGIEKAKIIAKVVISKDFLYESLQALKNGYYLMDFSKIDVIKFNQNGKIVVGFPFENQKGNVVMYVFSPDGQFLGTSPM